MENATEALMMAFAVLVFVIALTVAITSFNQVKAISDVVLYSKDETNYYDYQGATGKAAQNRIVGLETIIPTLYKYYKENYTVVFRQGNYNTETGEFSNLEPLTIYNTPSNYKTSNKKTYLWGKADGNQSTYDTLMQKKYNSYFTSGYTKTGNTQIFSFDLEEETLRHEPWTGSYEKAKENIDCFLYGTVYYNPNNNTKYIDYGAINQQGTNGFIGWCNRKNAQFVETIGEYTYSSSQSTDTEDGSSISTLVKDKNKRMIIFTFIK